MWDDLQYQLSHILGALQSERSYYERDDIFSVYAHTTAIYLKVRTRWPYEPIRPDNFPYQIASEVRMDLDS